ncbi:MAG: hypothetical protein K9N52_06460 [Verrucomicrobia bacterium]|nr:hypothetical protein [Verrucomicrobiota bacterium]
MKRVFALTVFLCSFFYLTCADAQIEASLVVKEDQFLPYEKLLVGVRVVNFSGNTLHLGRTDDWVEFSVESGKGRVVPKLDKVPMKKEFELPSAKRATRWVDVSPYFEMREPGKYTISATVIIEELQKKLSCEPVDVYIFNGARLWSQKFGVPASRLSDETGPVFRQYSLIKSRNMEDSKLYFKLTDVSGDEVYCVTPVCPMVSFSKPTVRISTNADLHILCQTGAKYFAYVVFNPAGDIVERTIYEYYFSRPVLTTDKEGNVIVKGGVHRPSDWDIKQTPPSVVSDQKGESQNNSKPGQIENKD